MLEGFIIALVLAGTAAGIAIAIKRGKKTISVPVLPEVPEHLVVIESGMIHVRKITALCPNIKDRAVANDVFELGLTAQEIFKNLKSDPSDVNTVKPFADYHLSRFIDLVEEYMRVAQNPPSPERDTAFAKFLEALQEEKKTFGGFLNECGKNDKERLALQGRMRKETGRNERPL